MRIHEFGTEHEKTVLLLHSACLSWRMFCPAVERLQTQYHLIVPALPAHDPDEKTPYTSVEAIAAELGGWLAQRGIGALWGGCTVCPWAARSRCGCWRTERSRCAHVCSMRPSRRTVRRGG